MVKEIIIAAVMTVMVKPTEVERLWIDAQAAFEAYRFDEAVELTDKYLADTRHDTSRNGECEELKRRANRAGEMLEAVEEITILDSVKTVKNNMLDFFGIARETGTLRQLETGGVMFTTGRGDRSIVAEKTEKDFDLYLKYSDGERHRLSETVNGTDNENYAFELTDGATLYFASDGHGSIGGYDLFVTRYNNETQQYSEPMHMGMPFNSIYNDYMLVIDELSDVGWFATDRFQNGDTVAIYKFKVTEEKTIMPQEVEEETRIASAMLKRYKVGFDEQRGAIAPKSEKNDVGTFRFVVNDTLIYTSESQFKDSLSVVKYRKMKELENAVNLQSVILEGKKHEYQSLDDDKARALIRKEILEDEEFISESHRQITELTKEIRKLEYLRLKNL